MGDTGGAYFRGRVPEQTRSPGRRSSRRRSRREAVAPPPITRVVFEADPGTMQMNLAIEGEAGEVLDRDRDEIVIPDFTAPELVLSTPYFVRARNALEFNLARFQLGRASHRIAQLPPYRSAAAAVPTSTRRGMRRRTWRPTC